MSALPPGSTIGILGGGQLGRMLALAAAALGFRCHIFSAEEDAPACAVAAASTRAPYDNDAALKDFAARVDVVTPEFENVPAHTAETLAAHVPVRPGPRALAICQDRIAEKTFAASLGLATARFAAIDCADDLSAALAAVGAPAILKTRRLGYDGKGQALVQTKDEAIAALETFNGAGAILEERVAFTREISVLLARSLDGAVAAYDPVWNIHKGGILVRSVAPAAIPEALGRAAVDAATRLAEALDYVGVMAVEFFVVGDRLLVNELAPRVHNSGHWTEDACAVSQFEQHIRAITGWPLGAPARHSDAVMDNLIGEAAADWLSLAADKSAHLHLYGKDTIRPGRKMGHVTRIYPLGAGPENAAPTEHGRS